MVEQRVDVVLVVGVVLVGDLRVDEPPLGQHEEVRLPVEVVLVLQVGVGQIVNLDETVFRMSQNTG